MNKFGILVARECSSEVLGSGLPTARSRCPDGQPKADRDRAAERRQPPAPRGIGGHSGCLKLSPHGFTSLRSILRGLLGRVSRSG